jgi:hypothetical protein
VKVYKNGWSVLGKCNFQTSEERHRSAQYNIVVIDRKHTTADDHTPQLAVLNPTT